MIATIVAAVAVTLLVSFSSAVEFAYDAPSLHVFLETAAGLSSLLAAYIVFGRFRESSHLDDLVLACALAVLSASAVCFAALLAATELNPGRFGLWAALSGRFLGAVLLGCAAFCPAARLRNAGRLALISFVGAGVLLAAIWAFVALFHSHLPVGVDPTMSGPEVRGRPQLSGHPVLLAVQLISAAIYAAAGVGFTLRAERTHDELLRWFSVGCVLASGAALHYFLFPSLYSRWVYTGDLLRLVATLVLLTGAGREIGRYWRNAATLAVLEERRRIARDLHDGTAQELAFIVVRLKRAEEGSVASPRLGEAAERALAEARRAIGALMQPVDEFLEVALAKAVGEVAGRFEQNVVLDLETYVRVDPSTREQVVRIAREAVTNAALHARASTVRVELSNDHRLRVKVADDGVGFEPNATDRTDHFGLVSMSERARALHADLHLTSAPGHGTEIELVLP